MKKKAIIILAFLMVTVFGAAEANPPAVYFSGMMNGIVLDAGSGYVSLKEMWVSNLPPTVTGGQLKIMKGAEVLYEMPWTVKKMDAPDAEISIGQPRNKENTAYESIQLTEPGDYSVDFYIDGNKFGTFPFKASKLGEKLVTDGQWNDWGYIYYADGDTDRQVEWKAWLRNFTTEPYKKVNVKVEITRDKDKKLICFSDPNLMVTLQNEWSRMNFGMKNPPNHPSGSEWTQAKTLLETDGAYTLTMTMAGQVYGVWKFNVKGNKLELTGRTVRGGDPLAYIQGSASSFWYQKQK